MALLSCDFFPAAALWHWPGHSLEFGFPDWEECRALAAAEYPDHAIHVKTEPPKIAVGEKSRRKKVASKSKSTTKKKKRV